MALEVVDLDGQAPDEILFAPCYNAMDHAGTPLRTRLYVLRHNPATNKLDVVAAAVLGVANSDLVGYGASALRVANLNGDATRHVIVATLNGELTVFEWDASGQTLGSRVFSLVTEGSLGGYGSMLVQDLDPANGLRPEIYLATSSGIRKWRIP